MQGYSLCVIVKQRNKAVGPLSVNIKKEGQVHDHSQREQQSLHRETYPDENDHSQHGQQAAVQVVLDIFKERRMGGGKNVQTG